ncbi:MULTISPECIES: tRNA (uridine(34)/cytosine(34)/5-carboxymethylaminomethyluridine(34)-2'-O)-methyltransferase TrmL [Paenibacillus]|uniref:tRNA (uridine(34)/cytosine(34)/5- carboxymethylaminomethyluridine(34)-2'-O)- methyltransferase TrmL n=1 Tax=Paenibacillus TaxID=44249 RepID=UPI00203CE9C3|nr:tRNA (uridine(34)/cytosine(34)/5-carboxymethylaminomethyluridine(34)-2'-O)-methyltransferase TrmL [Paenibacillus camelliae]MCM3634491.1 tRNA (uridine(34)/cytosine(34)/5-carboxymethylaminomethyluridine(34)-2'-O)-methyltransferase TrmL [Paenibacillus camelliae]
MAFHIVLVEPEIPANTGNIARTCAATGAHLHLVRPLGFSTDDKQLKRAGLDYWQAVHIEYHDSFAELQQKYSDATFYYASTKGKKYYSEFTYKDGDFLVFGKETKGLPEELIQENLDTCIKMPMTDAVRSLNLSNTVCAILYEALRQNSFPNLY